MKTLILYVLAALAAFGQAQTPLTIYQSSGSATGELRMQERRTNGQNYVGIAAPDAVAASVTWRWPGSDGAANQYLKTDGAGILSWGDGGGVSITSYDWSQSPGGSVAIGANTITLTPCPTSVDGTNASHYVYLSGGTGAAESVLITGGTCTSGATTGTITFTAVNTHTGAWTASSASDGLQEALYSVADGAKVAVVVPEGSYNVYATVSGGTRPVTISCASLGAILYAKTSSIKMLDSRSGVGPQVSNCTFRNDDSLTGVTVIYSNSADGPSSGGAFAGRIENNWFVNFDKSIHSVTTNGWHITGNHIISSSGYNATAGIHTEALTNGDQGTGLIAGNILTCSATCDYGLLWNGPGALQLKLNNFNGYTTQAYLRPTFGRASSSGSTVTWASGNKFRTNWVGTTIYLGGTSRTIASVDSDTQITTSTSIGTISATDYYINASSQASIMSNNFDAGTNTQYGVRWVGAVTFQNAQIEGNFFSNWSAVNNHEAISVDTATGLNFLGVRNNNIQSAGGTATYGIRVQSGYGYAVENNQIAGSHYGVALTTSTLVKVSGNQCILIGTACLTSTDATAEILESQSVTYAELAAMSAASGSRVYCSNCSAVCATAGTGAIASRVNGSWVCSDGSSSRWTLSGSNIYRASQVGIGAAPVSTAALSISGGSGANELYIADASATTAVQLIAESTYGVVGTYSNHEFHLASDSNARWTVGSTGMFKPFIHDTYDIGLTGTRVRGVYAGFGEFYKAGGTYSSDYVSSRKFNILDLSGGSGAWDMYAAGSMVANSQWTMRDNAGSRALQITRAISGSPTRNISAFGNLYPAKRVIADGDAVDDATFGDLGDATARWANINGVALDLTGAADIDGNLSAAVINATGSPAYRVGGTSVILADRSASFTALTINTSTPSVVGQVWTATNTAGAGSWQASTASQWTTSGSDIYYSTGKVTMGGATPTAAKVTIAGTAGTDGLDLSTNDMYVNARVFRNSTGAADKHMYFGYFSGATSSLFFHANNAEVMKVEGAGVTVTGLLSSTGNFSAAVINATGSPAYRVSGTTIVDASRNGTFVGLTTSGAVSLASSTITASSTFSSDLIATSNATYALGSNGVRWLGYMNTLNVNGAFTMNGTVTGDWNPTTSNTYVLGSSSAYWNQIAGETVFVEAGSVRPRTGGAGTVGISTARFSKAWLQDLDFTGTLTPPSGTAFSGTKTVRASGGAADCTLTFSAGIMTGGTC